MGKFVLGSIVFLFVLSAQPVFAHGGHEASKEAAVSANAVEVGNKICPVSGDKIEKNKMGEAVKQEYNDKIYNLCCSMCVKDFQKDPAKYSKIADDEVAAQTK